MKEENGKIIVEHRETGKLQDSIELGTPAKGGSIKIYGDFLNKEEFEKRIDSAVELRKYGNKKIEE